MRSFFSCLAAVTLAACAALGCSSEASEEAGDEDESSVGALSEAAGRYCGEVKRLASEGKLEQLDCGITRGPKTEKKIALVFTAGYFCEQGPAFLDALAQYRAKASFFMLSPAAKGGDAASKCGVTMPRLVSEGHLVGLHSDTHPDMVDRQGGATKVTREKFDKEISKNTEVLRSKGVQGDIRYWMPPSETFNTEIATWSADKGLRTVHMTECAQTRGDYLPVTAQGGKFTNDAILKRVLSCASSDPNGLNGAILFFHLGMGTARADADKFQAVFPEMLKKLTDAGYAFVRVDELLDPVLPR